MTRAQFLNDLYRRLHGLTQEQAEQHLTYYAEMLADRMEEGMSEEEAVASMEPLDVIAQRILQDEGVPESSAQPPKYPDLPKTDGSRFTKAPAMPRKRNRRKLILALLWAAAAAAAISAVGRWSARRYASDSSEATAVDYGIAEEYAEDWDEYAEDWEEYMEDWDGWGNTLFQELESPQDLEITPDGVFGSCFSLTRGSISVQDNGYDIQVGPDGVDLGGAFSTWADGDAASRYRYADDVYRLDVDEAQDISVKWNTGVVQIQGWDEEYIQFQEFSDTKLKQPQKLEYSVDGYMLNISKGAGLEKGLTVWVPTHLLDCLSVETSTADIYYDQLTAAEGTASATSGQVVVTNSAFGNLDAGASSGSVLLRCVAAVTLEADATSGGVCLDAVAAEDLDVSTTSGHISGLAAGGGLYLESSSGRITVNAAASDGLHLSSSSGDITAALPSIVPPAYIGAGTSSGDVVVLVPEEIGFALSFDSSSGYFAHGPFSVVRSQGMYYTDGSVPSLMIAVSTSSGDLRLGTA